MLTPLGNVVRRWTPQGGGNGKRAVADGRSAADVLPLWKGIVGDEVARHATPLERNGDALVVLTTSSAWSNQLSLLGGHIVCALREAGINGIERLRFRVGRLRRSGAHTTEPASGRRLHAVIAPASGDESGPSATLEDAVSRLRSRLARTRDAKRAEGWNVCRKCGVLLPEGDRCAPCATAEFSQRSVRVQRLMFDVPWLGYSGMTEIVEGLTREEYEANRAALLARWSEALERVRKTGRLSPDGRERQIASSYLLLQTGWEPERITPVIARSQLGDELYGIIYEKHHNEKQ